jgi:transposase InsO family protein
MSAPQSLPDLSTIPEYKRLRVEQRQRVLELWETYLVNHVAAGRVAGTKTFVQAFNDFSIDPELRRQVDGLTVSTLYRWKQRYDARGLVGLCDGYGTRKGKGVCDQTPSLRKWWLQVLDPEKGNPDIRNAGLYTLLRAQRPDLAEKIGERALIKWATAWRKENASYLDRLKNPDDAKNRHQMAMGDADESIVRLNQRWEQDSTPADVMLQGKRYSLVGGLDVWSRRFKIHVAPVSASAHIASLTRWCLQHWGKPEEILTDNGSDYVSAYYDDVLRELGIRHITARPFHGEDKPHIERVFRTFSHGLLELAPGFIGHNVAERKAIESRHSFAERLLMSKKATIELSWTPEELQKFCDTWCTTVYERTVHSKLKMTPFEKAQSWTGPRFEVPADKARALDLLLLPNETRKVLKKGIPLQRMWFIHGELGALEGQDVVIKRDPMDLGRIVVLKPGRVDENGKPNEFVCIAINADLAGVERRQIAAVGQARQNEFYARIREETRVAKREERIGDLQADLLAFYEREAAQITALQRSGTPYQSEALDTAAVAAAALDAEKGQRLTGPVSVDKPAPKPVTQTDDERRDNELWEKYQRALATPPSERNDLDRALLKRPRRGTQRQARQARPAARDLLVGAQALRQVVPGQDRRHPRDDAGGGRALARVRGR